MNTKLIFILILSIIYFTSLFKKQYKTETKSPWYINKKLVTIVNIVYKTVCFGGSKKVTILAIPSNGNNKTAALRPFLQYKS